MPQENFPPPSASNAQVLAAIATMQARLLGGLASLQQSVNYLISRTDQMSQTLDQSIQQLIADNAQLKSEVDSAPAAIASLIAVAIAQQQQAGVTAAQMQALIDLHTSLSGEASQLQAALAGTAPTIPNTGTTDTSGAGTTTG